MVNTNSFLTCINIILQVDISTMLEEAAQYVKFLQLQIKVSNKKFHASRLKICNNQIIVTYTAKMNFINFMSNNYVQLLSSDDMWMYAPIAYNGINISSIDLNISPLQK